MILNHRLDLDLRQQIDNVFVASINLGMAFLAAVAAYLRYRHAIDARFEQGVFYRLETRGADDCFQLFHNLVVPIQLRGSGGGGAIVSAYDADRKTLYRRTAIMSVMLKRLVLCLFFAAAAFAAPRQIDVTLDPAVAPRGASGRLLVFLADNAKPRAVLSGGFIPGETWMAAMEISYFAPGSTIAFDAEHKAFPKP